MTKLLRLLGGYTLLQVIGLVAPFVALPTIAQIAGPAGWAYIASAQALGSVASVIILFGWWTAGPGELYRLGDGHQRLYLYRQSVVGRLIVTAAILPILLIGIYLLFPTSWHVVCIAMALATAVPGLSPAWLFVARGEPAKLAIYEVVPRSAASVAAIPVMRATDSILFYPTSLIFVTIAAYAAAWFVETPRSGMPRTSIKGALGDLRSHTPIALSNLIGALYSQSMVPIAAAVAPATTIGGFVSAEKLYRASRFTIVATGNTLQAWTLAANTRRNHLRAIGAHFILGVGGGACIFLATPLVTHRLFGAELAASYPTAAALGGAFLCTSMTTPIVRNILIPHGRKYVTLAGTIAALVVGFASIYPLHAEFGSDGFAFAMLLSEVVGLSINAWGARDLLVGRTSFSLPNLVAEG